MSVAVIVINVMNEQPAGDCTDHVALWLWVYMGAILLGAVTNAAVVLTARPGEKSAAASGAVCCQSTVGLFGFAWWVTGIVWYTQTEDAGCAKPAMDLMLAAIILPGVMLALACCLMCVMGGAMLATVRKNEAQAGVAHNTINTPLESNKTNTSAEAGVDTWA